ncbi:MAG TPA: NAD-binding protein, partial [Casimicrobiaceae bacterium]
AEAMALARGAGLDLRQTFEVINASSGASWIFTDRVARALDGDFTPRAAARILAKDVGIAVTVAQRLGVDTPCANLAQAAFADALAAGYGDDDDAVLVKRAFERGGK